MNNFVSRHYFIFLSTYQHSIGRHMQMYFIHFFISNSADDKLKKNSEYIIVGQKINEHAAWHCRAFNLIKSRLLHATG